MGNVVVVQMPEGKFVIANKLVADVVYALTPCKTLPEYRRALKELNATKPDITFGEGFKRFGPGYNTSLFCEELGPEVPIDIYRALEAVSVSGNEERKS